MNSPKFVRENGRTKCNHILWEVICPYCEKKYTTMATSIRNKKSTKCVSCARKMQNMDSLRKYKCRNKKLYDIWRNMNARCYGNNKILNKNYKDKKVKVCKEWRFDFDCFAEWALSNGYKEGLEIDKDKLCQEKDIFPKIYSPKTCLFMTKKENSKYRDTTFNEQYKRPSKVTCTQRDEIFKLKREGNTQQEIAEIYNLKRATVSHILNGRIKNFS